MNEISVLNVVVNKSSDVVRHVFVKRLATDKDRSIILINLPCFCDGDSIGKIFSSTFGDILSLSFHSSIEKIGINEATYDGEKLSPLNGYRTAVIKFKKSSGLQSLYQFIESKDNLYLYGEGKPLTGIRRWQQCYNESILDIKSTKEEIADYMDTYDKKVHMEKELAKANEGVPDADGWVKVTRHGKKSFLPNTDSLDKKITQQMKQKRLKTEIFPREEKVKSDVL